MTRRFLIAALLTAVVIGVVVFLSFASADDGRNDGFSADQVTGETQVDVPME